MKIVYKKKKCTALIFYYSKSVSKRTPGSRRARVALVVVGKISTVFTYFFLSPSVIVVSDGFFVFLLIIGFVVFGNVSVKNSEL